MIFLAENCIQAYIITADRTQGLEMRRIGLKCCPYCGGDEVYSSSAKTFWEKLPALLLLRFVRCDECRRRHFRPIFISAPVRPSKTATLKKPVQLASDENREQRQA